MLKQTWDNNWKNCLDSFIPFKETGSLSGDNNTSDYKNLTDESKIHEVNKKIFYENIWSEPQKRLAYSETVI